MKANKVNQSKMIVNESIVITNASVNVHESTHNSVKIDLMYYLNYSPNAKSLDISITMS